MSRGPGVLLTVFLIAGCLALFMVGGKVFGFVGPEAPQNSPQATQTAQGAILATATIVDMATASPGPTVTATTDPQIIAAAETAQAWQATATQAEKDREDWQIEQLAIYGAGQSARSTSDEKERILEETRFPATATMQVIALTLTPAAKTATAYAPILAATYTQLATDLEYVEVKAAGDALGNVLLGLGVLVGVVFVVVRFVQINRQPAPVEDEQDEPERAPVGHAEFMDVAPRQKMLADIPCTASQFRAWASAMLQGGNAGINEWEGSGKPFGRNSYKPFLAWAEKRGIVSADPQESNAKKLTPNGILFCTDWFRRNDDANQDWPLPALPVREHANPAAI